MSLVFYSEIGTKLSWVFADKHTRMKDDVSECHDVSAFMAIKQWGEVGQPDRLRIRDKR